MSWRTQPSASPLRIVDIRCQHLIVIYIKTRRRWREPVRTSEGGRTASTRTLPTRSTRYTVLKSDTPDREAIRRDAHMTFNINYYAVPGTASTAGRVARPRGWQAP